jgi:ABC-type multidrug transport system fused ATPase/permease subunit
MEKQGIVQILNACLRVLTKSDRTKYRLIVLIQASLGLLDLIGVALLGIVGALSISGVQSQPTGERVTKILNFLNLNSISFQLQVTYLAALSIIFFISKTILTIYLSRKILHFLGRRGAAISSELVSKVLAQKYLSLKSYPSQEIQYAAGLGITAITVGILGVGSTLVADLSLLIIIAFGMALVDPSMALSSTVLFGSIGTILYFTLHTRARRIGLRISQLTIESNQRIFESLQMFREIYVRNRQYYYSNEISKLKTEHSRIFAEQTFLPSISKYVVEITMVIGIFVMAGTQFLAYDASRAAASIALFIAAASRIAPAILRLQQSLVQIQGNFGTASPTLSILQELQDQPRLAKVPDKFENSHLGFEPIIRVKNLRFNFGVKDSIEIDIPELEIRAGEKVAIVGPSGAGKTTLIDLILGIHDPIQGKIEISDQLPSVAISTWPGAVSYVPQQVNLSSLSLIENIQLGFPIGLVPEFDLEQSLKKVDLNEVISKLPEGVHSLIGEDGYMLSGGQRQRVGIARALLTNPKLIILDEATSALDGQSEKIINETISKLESGVTVLHIAHRLSTVKDADKVIYMENGKILAIGSFDEVRKAVPNFDRQASLMGL